MIKDHFACSQRIFIKLAKIKAECGLLNILDLVGVARTVHLSCLVEVEDILI